MVVTIIGIIAAIAAMVLAQRRARVITQAEIDALDVTEVDPT